MARAEGLRLERLDVMGNSLELYDRKVCDIAIQQPF